MKTDLIYMRMIELACLILNDFAVFNHHVSQFNIMSMKRRPETQNYEDSTTER